MINKIFIAVWSHNKLKKKSYLVALLIFIGFGGCKISYDLSGVNISPETKTFSVQYFPNRAPLVEPSLSSLFTEKMKDKFIGETNLDMANGYGDLNFEGEITGYRIEPKAIGQGDVAALNTLTITIRVKYTNKQDSKQDFDKSFSQFVDFSSQNIKPSAEELEKVIDDIINNIFNESVVNW